MKKSRDAQKNRPPINRRQLYASVSLAHLRFLRFALFHMLGAPAGARYLRPFLRRSLSVRRPPGVARRARNPEVRARARRVPCSVHPSDRPPATTTSAPRPFAGARAATARGTTTPRCAVCVRVWRVVQMNGASHTEGRSNGQRAYEKG